MPKAILDAYAKSEDPDLQEHLRSLDRTFAFIFNSKDYDSKYFYQICVC